VDWFEDQLKEMHKKTRTKEAIQNDKEIKEYVEMMRSHRDQQFKEDLAKLKEEMAARAVRKAELEAQAS
jgi:hypothetical protein